MSRGVAPDPAKVWGSGIRERATAAFQRSSRRGIVADLPGTDHTSSRVSAETTPPVSLPANMYEGKSKADMDLTSTRWLNEVKASTEKEASSAKCAKSRSRLKGTILTCRHFLANPGAEIPFSP
jgi:hypothetical protein